MACPAGFKGQLAGRWCVSTWRSFLSWRSFRTRWSWRTRCAVIAFTSGKSKCQCEHDEDRPGPSFQCVEPVHFPTPMHLLHHILIETENRRLSCSRQISSAVHSVGNGKSCNTDFCQFRRRKSPWILRMREGCFGGIYVRIFSNEGHCTAWFLQLSAVAREAFASCGFTSSNYRTADCALH